LWKQIENKDWLMAERHATEPHVVCPNCSHPIPLTESLAAPLLEAARKDFRDQLAAKDSEFSRKADELRRQQEDLALARESIEDQITQRLKSERSLISAAEAKKAKEIVGAELQASKAQLAEAKELLEQNNAKLAEAQQAQADLLRKQRELDEQKRELELTIEKRVQATQSEILIKAR
jgi:DNA repair exonuclease SbcCD ATPase subunit